MRPFILDGTDYNRPICRRIVEEAGVPRHLFGMQKKAVEPPLWREPLFLTPQTYQDYLDWLRKNRVDWWNHFRLPPWRSIQGDLWINSLSSAAAAAMRSCGRRMVGASHSMPALRGFAKRLSTVHPKLLNLRRYWLPWAVERAKQRYTVMAGKDEPVVDSSGARVPVAVGNDE
jgi:hypothetical protein